MHKHNQDHAHISNLIKTDISSMQQDRFKNLHDVLCRSPPWKEEVWKAPVYKPNKLMQRIIN